MPMTLAPILAAPLAVQIHLAAAVLSIAAGAAQFLRVKSGALHKAFGWAGVSALAITSISTFWITSLTPGHYTLIHLLSLATLLALVNGIRARRRGDIRNHKRLMITAYLGLTGAGLAALLPPRVLARMLFG